MNDQTGQSQTKLFVDEIETVERKIAAYLATVKKLQRRLSQAKKELNTKPAIGAQVTALITTLRTTQLEPPGPVLTQLIQSLETQLGDLQKLNLESFPSELRKACEAHNLAFAAQTEGYVVGSFFLIANVAQERARFQFAKIDVQSNLPLDPNVIADQAQLLRASLLDAPIDLHGFRSELYEAIRVAAARHDRKLTAAEIRVELPEVYREMTFIRSLSETAKRKTAEPVYSLVRFIIDLIRFIQSDLNLETEQFRLESAVIENTKNPKKSIFIPRDLSKGNSEGTYFQAIVLRQL